MKRHGGNQCILLNGSNQCVSKYTIPFQPHDIVEKAEFQMWQEISSFRGLAGEAEMNRMSTEHF